MAARTETKIFEALMAHLALFSYSPALPVKWPGRAFAVPSGGYIRPAHLPGTTTQMAVSDAGTRHHVGVAQVDVFWPEGEGVTLPLEAAGALVAHFAKGTKIDREGVRVRVEDPPTVAAPLQEPGWLQVPVSVPYHCFSEA